jgi:hypothetical protein
LIQLLLRQQPYAAGLAVSSVAVAHVLGQSGSEHLQTASKITDDCK